MQKIIRIVIFLVVAAAIGLFFYKYNFKEKEFFTPGPLRYESKSTKSSLTASGTLEWTNIQREANGNLSPLSINEKLNLAAKAKMDDIFIRQYFAHYGPGDTFGASDLAEDNGYEYIMIGENLALGNFENDKELVQAWMDSPGHRANILNSKFSEIGISVGRGTFEGKQTWVAVQIFAKPLSSCPKVDETVKAGIDRNQLRLESMKAELERKRNAVNEYNKLVNEYNQLVKETKGLIDLYNSQVRAYNNCVQK